MATSRSVSTSSTKPLKIGFIGLGMGASQILPQVEALQEIELVAGADINPAVLNRFHVRYPEAHTFQTAEDLCADPDVEAVWVATPNQFHSPYAVMAAEHGKHVVSEKPMATSLADAEKMVEAAERNKVKLLCGHTLGFSPPVRAMRRLIRSRQLGAVRFISSVAYTDWMLAPRTAEEVDFSQGGGVIYRQTPHQLDTVRVLAASKATRVRGTVGQWAPERPKAPGFYSAFITFGDGTAASITYNGYGYFQTSELVPWGHDKGLVTRATPEERAEIRRQLREGARNEDDLKDALRVGGREDRGAAIAAERSAAWVPNHLGILLVTCEQGDLRHSPHGLYVYDHQGARDVPIPDGAYLPGQEDLIELYEAVRFGKPVYHDGLWGMGMLEIIMSLLQSSREGREVELTHQIVMREDYE